MTPPTNKGDALPYTMNEKEAMARAAWDAGFKTCQDYGDNWFHCFGEQRERVWKKYWDEAGKQSVQGRCGGYAQRARALLAQRLRRQAPRLAWVRVPRLRTE